VTDFWREEEARWTVKRRTFLPDRPRERVPRGKAWKKESRWAECFEPSAAPDNQSSYYRRIGEREREGLEIIRNLELW